MGVNNTVHFFLLLPEEDLMSKALACLYHRSSSIGEYCFLVLFLTCLPHHHHHHQSLNREGRWGTTDDFATSFLHFSLFSTALWDLPNSRPVHSLMLSSHLFLCPPCLLSPPFHCALQDGFGHQQQLLAFSSNTVHAGTH